MFLVSRWPVNLTAAAAGISLGKSLIALSRYPGSNLSEIYPK